jgi:hypothetical protein
MRFFLISILEARKFLNLRFAVHKSKEATARVAMWRELKIANTYTMESSFCGPNIVNIKNHN